MVGQDLINRHPPGQLAHKMYSTVMRGPLITGLPNIRDSLCWFLLAKFDLAAGKVTCPLFKNGLEHLIFFRREINPHPDESFQVVLTCGWCVPPEGFQKGDRHPVWTFDLDWLQQSYYFAIVDAMYYQHSPHLHCPEHSGLTSLYPTFVIGNAPLSPA